MQCVCVLSSYTHISGAVYSHFTYYNHATTPITLSQYNSLLNFSFLIHLRLNLCCVLSFVVHLFCIDYSILISLSFSEYSSCPIYSSDTVRVKRAKQVSVTLSCWIWRKDYTILNRVRPMLWQHCQSDGLTLFSFLSNISNCGQSIGYSVRTDYLGSVSELTTLAPFWFSLTSESQRATQHSALSMTHTMRYQTAWQYDIPKILDKTGCLGKNLS